MSPETQYYQRALAIAVALMTGRLELAMLATYGPHTRFAHVTIDEIVSAARNGWSVAVFAVPPDLHDRAQLNDALEQDIAHWLGDYYEGQPACGELLWLLHVEFTGELFFSTDSTGDRFLSSISYRHGQRPRISRRRYRVGVSGRPKGRIFPGGVP